MTTTKTRVKWTIPGWFLLLSLAASTAAAQRGEPADPPDLAKRLNGKTPALFPVRTPPELAPAEVDMPAFMKDPDRAEELVESSARQLSAAELEEMRLERLARFTYRFGRPLSPQMRAEWEQTRTSPRNRPTTQPATQPPARRWWIWSAAALVGGVFVVFMLRRKS